MGNKYTVFIVQGYEIKTPDGGLVDVIIFEIIADNEKDAIKRSKELFKKKEYRVKSIIENFVPNNK